MNGQRVAYKRVSSADQVHDRQLDGITFDREFSEKISGATAERPQLQECLAYLRHGDELHVHSIDRAARNLADLLRIIKELIHKGVSVHFHKESLTFTGETNPFQTLQLQIIGAVAEFERAIIHERQREGIAVAKRKGKHLGRRPSLNDAQELAVVEEVARAAQNGQSVNLSDLARRYGVSRPTVRKTIKKHEVNHDHHHH